MKASRPKVSVIVPMYNSRETIGKCIESLSAIDHHSYEVILVDDGSTDGTAEICDSYAHVKVIRLDKGGPSRARNMGVSTARGDLVAFTDSDCVVDRQWLKELEKGFVTENVAGAGGDQISPDDETQTGRLIQEYLKTVGFVTDYIKSGASVRETDHNPSCNSAYRKTVLEEVGGFNEALWPGEDVELDLKIRRLGYRLIYNPAAVVRHYRPKTILAFAAMMKRYGATQRYLVKKYGFFRKLHCVPIAVVVGLALIALIIGLFPDSWPVLFVPLLVMFLWFYFKTRDLRKGVRFTYLMVVTLVSWNLGFLIGFRGLRRE